MTRHTWVQILCMALCLSTFASLSSASESCTYKSTATSVPLADTLHRGVNLSGWWEHDRHNTLLEWDFQNIHNMGFDFVRIPVTPEWLLMQNKKAEAQTLAMLRCNIISILNHHLTVVFDLHPGKDSLDIMSTMPPDALQAYILGAWKAATPVFKDIPANRIALQLLNEPDQKLEPYWWNMQGKMVTALRKLYPDNLIIVGSTQNGFWNYASKQPYPDTNLLYDFHFYQPMYFTHHAAEWMKSYTPAQKKENVPYPVTNTSPPPDASEKLKEYITKGWNKETLAAQLTSVFDWAARSHVKLICLEFGVYHPYVSVESRTHWLHDMREILEANHIPWAVWEYNQGFGIRTADRQTDTAIRAALGMNPYQTNGSNVTR